MKKPSIFTNKVSEAETTTTSVPQTNSKQSKIPLDAHEVLDFYKSHSVEIKAILQTMGGTNRSQQMFMLGYYIGYTKR